MSCETDPSAWLELGKTVLSTFAGALLAFGTNLHLQRLQRRRSNLAAGNMALSILSKQFGDFAVFSAWVDQELQELNGWPMWLKMKPSVIGLSENLRFDLPSLSFLFEHQEHELLGKLMEAETCYHELRTILAQSTEACDLRNQRLAEAGFSNPSLADLHKMENAVGAVLEAKCDAFNSILKSRSDKDAKVYHAAGEALRAAMRIFFEPEQVAPFVPLGANTLAANAAVAKAQRPRTQA